MFPSCGKQPAHAIPPAHPPILTCNRTADANPLPRSDRVFSYALNTVNKVHTGEGKPPVATRLKLYGLYKQAMGMTSTAASPRDPDHRSRYPLEGDVDGIMDRPEGNTEEAQRGREKWYVRGRTLMPLPAKRPPRDLTWPRI